MTLHVPEGECWLFLWQNQNTVVIGRNQDAWQECRVNLLEEDGGHLVRRLSGGGAVYHDLGNLNYTFMVRHRDYDVDKQLEVILRAVQLLGIRAKRSGRNDVLMQGRKFSGSAFYRSGEFCYHHGTLLLHSDVEKMERYLQVSLAKLASKSVKSVRARVTNIGAYVPDITPAVMCEKLREAFGLIYALPVETMTETELPEEEIAELQERFASPAWCYGRKEPFTYRASHRFDWGELCLQFSIDKGRMQKLRVFSDAMEQDYAPMLEKVLTGSAYNMKTLFKAVDGIELEAERLPRLKEDTKELLKSVM